MESEVLARFLFEVSHVGCVEKESDFDKFSDSDPPVYDGKEFIAVTHPAYEGSLVLYEVPLKTEYVFQGIPVPLKR